MNKKQLTVAESACIITGYGIGGGVMAMPYLAQKNGVVVSLLILAAAFGASFVLHVMIAELAVKSGGGSQIIEVFSRYLFQGKYQKVLTAGFFVIMALVLFTNLAAYISGAAEIISELLGISLWLSRLLFYAAAASVVLFGLKAVGISEKLAVTVIFLPCAYKQSASGKSGKGDGGACLFWNGDVCLFRIFFGPTGGSRTGRRWEKGEKGRIFRVDE